MKKAAIVLREDMGMGLLANATACMVTGLFEGESDVLGKQIEGADCVFIPITKIPILVLKQGNKDFADLLSRAKTNNLKYMLFTREGQSTTSYEEYVERVKGKSFAEVDTVGIGVIGEENAVTKFAGDLGLFR